MPTGGVISDDTTPDTPYRRVIERVTRQWSGNQQRVVGGIPLLSRRWTDGYAHLPGDGRIADHAHDGVTTTDPVQAPVTAAAARGGPLHPLGCDRRSARVAPVTPVRAARAVADPAARPSRG